VVVVIVEAVLEGLASTPAAAAAVEASAAVVGVVLLVLDRVGLAVSWAAVGVEGAAGVCRGPLPE
jgi:hypothetical protein